ncbi:MAG: hypothetical protein ABIE94_04620 [archaeon]
MCHLKLAVLAALAIVFVASVAVAAVSPRQTVEDMMQTEIANVVENTQTFKDVEPENDEDPPPESELMGMLEWWALDDMQEAGCHWYQKVLAGIKRATHVLGRPLVQ